MLILTRVLIVILVKLLQLALRPVCSLLSVAGSVSSLRGRYPGHIFLYNIWNGARRKAAGLKELTQLPSPHPLTIQIS